MYGTRLDEDKPSAGNCGIGPYLAGVDDDQGLRNAPTHTYKGPRQRIVVGGDVELDLIHAPGETDDQTVVYYPKHGGILFAADNYYESFPNLYTIRGAPNRDAVQWADSLDTMIATEPEIMVPSHTLPVYGADEIRLTLTNYRDAIQYVHDQTVRLMLQDYHPDDIAATLQLPSNLRNCEYLKEYYGTVGWSAKSIFHGYMGWFSGDVTELWPIPPAQYAARLVDLAGGDVQHVLDKAQQAYDDGDYRWSLELSSAILRADTASKSSWSTTWSTVNAKAISTSARKLKSLSCTRLGEQEISANGRNWYMTCAKLADGSLDESSLKVPDRHRTNFLKTSDLSQIFQVMTVRFRPNESLVGVSKSMSFLVLPDDGIDDMDKNSNRKNDGDDDDDEEEMFYCCHTLTIRNCVLYYRKSSRRVCRRRPTDGADDLVLYPDERDNDTDDIVMETTEAALRDVFAKRSVATLANNLWSNQLRLRKGDVQTFLQFFKNLDLAT